MTQFLLKKAIILSVVFTSASVFADPVLDAHKEKAKAYDQYFNAVYSLKKPTPEQKKQLKEKIVTPKVKKYNKAIADQVQKTANKLYERNKSPSISKAGSKEGDAKETEESVTKKKKIVKKPEEKLEGKDVIRYLEFPGKKEE